MFFTDCVFLIYIKIQSYIVHKLYRLCLENYVYEEPYGEISINVYIETHPTNNEFKLTVTGMYIQYSRTY